MTSHCTTVVLLHYPSMHVFWDNNPSPVIVLGVKVEENIVNQSEKGFVGLQSSLLLLVVHPVQGIG